MFQAVVLSLNLAIDAPKITAFQVSVGLKTVREQDSLYVSVHAVSRGSHLKCGVTNVISKCELSTHGLLTL